MNATHPAPPPSATDTFADVHAALCTFRGYTARERRAMARESARLEVLRREWNVANGYAADEVVDHFAIFAEVSS